jgi:hypothetical protein
VAATSSTVYRLTLEMKRADLDAAQMAARSVPSPPPW